MVEFVDELEPLDAAWTSWANSQARSPVWLAQVDLADDVTRHVGCYVTPANTVLGLRAWDDADEGADPEPWALFDIEKLVRMALHQSGLAFETLSSPRCWGQFPARDVATSAVTRDILNYYHDVTQPLEVGATQAWRWRTLLTGALLARDGVVSHRMSTLTELLGVPDAPEPALAAELRASLASPLAALPEQVEGYDFLDELVVASRLGP